MTLILETFYNNNIIKVDEKTKQALRDIKRNRNEIVAHNSSAGLSNEEFNTVWDDIAKVSWIYRDVTKSIELQLLLKIVVDVCSFAAHIK